MIKMSYGSRFRMNVEEMLLAATLGLFACGSAWARDSDIKIWTSFSAPRFSFQYHTCWLVDAPRPGIFAETVSISPSKDCAKPEGGKWKIVIVKPMPGMRVDRDVRANDSIIAKNAYRSTINHAGKRITFYQEQDFQKIRWNAEVECFGFQLIPKYEEQIDDRDLEKVFREHKIPPTFKKFALGIMCDKRKKGI